MKPEAPLPVSGVFTVGTATLVFGFDRALQPGLINAANWAVHSGSQKYVGTVATAASPAAHQVTVTMFPQMPPPAPGNRAYFNPPPFDVLSLTGAPAALFADFPITAV